MKKILKFFLPIYFIVVTICSFNASSESSYITNSTDFHNEIKKGKSVIYVDDIAFEKETDISINYDVRIIGKSGKSTIKNAVFTLVGSNVPGESVDISFKNIILDGGIEKSDYDFSGDGKTFYSMFGDSDRTNKRAISGTWGYFSLNMDNCEIKKYASYDGPAIYVDNNSLFREGKRIVNLSNSKFHNNICYQGTVTLFNDNGIFDIDNCIFTKNTAKTSAGAVLSNGTVSVVDSKINDNYFYRFVDTNDDGSEKYPNDKMTIGGREYNYVHTSGALYIGGADARVKNCEITNNKSVYGGGVGVASPNAVVGGQKIEFINCIISDNTANCGGAIYAKSNSGHSVNFINCNIFGNSAKKGGILYTTTLAPYSNDKTIAYGGNISFIFCSMAENTDDNAGSFSYNELRMQALKGNIELLGCMVIDNASYSNLTDNYVATKEQALTDGAVTSATLGNIYTNGLSPIKGSKADISVSADVYTAWNEIYHGNTNSKKIGAISFDKFAGVGNNGSSTSNDEEEQEEKEEKEEQEEVKEKEKEEKKESTESSKATTSSKENKTSKKGNESKSDASNKSQTTKNKTDYKYSSSDIPSDESVIETSKETEISIDNAVVSSEVKVSKQAENKKANNKLFLWIIICFAVAFSGGVTLYYLKFNKKNKKEIEETAPNEKVNYSDIPYDDLLIMITQKYKDKALTNKELQVATLLLICEKRKDIAERLFVSEDTVKTHISHIYKKLGVSSKEDFVKLTDEL